ncbi:hypothetical protein NEISICOT_00750 [Neisseria sicca ATCC 29256]|uniref:Uncharacterized protein n=1 Tax=Neisseria sicca ATCC 29256 TaxID=547045 RepID=C6M2L0_NEISI|nr:hypothetical protein NEISICOT_00750 [Neisseria sicca ATCC 29256]
MGGFHGFSRTFVRIRVCRRLRNLNADIFEDDINVNLFGFPNEI